MSEADSVDAVRRLQFSSRHEVGFGIGSDHGPIDRAFDFVALYGHRDLLCDRLAWPCRFVDGIRCAAAPAVHLEWLRPESAHDEVAVPIGGTVETALLRRSHIV